jgi:hypothetical protein
MPRYELEITSQDGDPTQGTHESEDTLDVDDTFEYQEATLVVTAVEEPDDESFDAKLVCAHEGGRPHYF